MRCEPQFRKARLSRLPAVFALVCVSFGAIANADRAVPEPTNSVLPEGPITVFSIAARPAAYSGQHLADRLFQKLTDEEMALVKNPLARTPEMNEWAGKVTSGTTNQMQKAKLLFDAVVRRINPPGPGGTRTAQEVFAAWKSPVSFCCEEYANLYVALARAAGLQAFSVYVVEQFTGATPRHACAAVFTGGDDVVLVDATIPWFGVPHRSTIILDDVQAIAAHLVQTPGLKERRVAYKLAPDLSVVESNFYLSLMNESQWDEARKVLDDMPRWRTEAWVTNMAQGRWALHEGKPAVAVNWLKQAIQLNPWVGVCRRMLGDALFQQGLLHESRKALRESLAYLFDEFNIASVHQLIVDIDELLADRAGSGRADPALENEVDEDKKDDAAGDPFAMKLLARRYERGNGVQKDLSQAVELYRKAAQTGDPQAMEQLGTMFFLGRGVEKDPAQVVLWWTRAGNAGNSEAMSSLGKIYLGGYGVAENNALAFEWFERGANRGHPVAISSLGWMYTHGVGVEKDYAKGLAWLRKAADGNNAFAMHELGLMYLTGKGVVQSDQQAEHWFQKGAEAGDPASMNDLGTIYSSGKGVLKDDSHAFTWFRKAAEAGNPPAMFNLGSAYENGEGTKKDEAEAMRWYQQAQKAGVEEAAKRLECLTNHISNINGNGAK